MNTFQIMGAALALSVSSISFAHAAPKDAKEYVSMAASSDMLEIESSKMALETSKTENLRVYAQHMIRDHSNTTSDLMTAAKAENIMVPTKMMPKHAEMLQMLQNTSADDFDAQYVKLQVMAHEEAVALHATYAKNGDDAALQAVAAKAVPIVTEHLQDAQRMAPKA